MVFLRNFSFSDAEKLQCCYPGEPVMSIKKLICEWNTKIHDGRYFEMFAVIREDTIVGSMSLYQHTSEVISVGPEIFPPFRRQGLAYEGMMLALQHAAEKGYRIAVAQVRRDNTASMALHRKAGFEIDHDFVNRKGNECFFLIKSIG